MSLDFLNEQQREAVLHKDGPMMVLAGPGSGKTMVITHRVRRLIQEHGISPRDILVITFTKAAAVEMKERFLRMTKDSGHYDVNFGTFHSFFFRILRTYYPYTVHNIIKEEVKYQVIKGIINELGITYEDEQEFIGDYQLELSLMKNELIHLNYYNSVNFSSDDFRLITAKYEAYKSEKGLIDFDDMLFLCYQCLTMNEKLLGYWQKKYKYILIDEFQDINRAQYEIVKMLVGSHHNIFIVGDDDQSIYRFRGARPEFLLNFPKDFEGTSSVTLSQNYRSNEQIISRSCKVISKNKKRYEKELNSVKGTGSEPKVLNLKDTEEEAIHIAKNFMELHQQGIPYDEMAVIFRTNIQARALVDILLDHNIPFVLRDQVPSLYDHWIAKDILAYLKAAHDLKDKESLIRVTNKPKRYMAKWVLNEASRSPKDFFPFIYEHEDLKSWQVGKIEEYEGQLIMLKIKPPREAIRYIRKTIGYDDYLTEYSKFRKISVKGLKEVLDELQESAKNFETLGEYLTHIEEINTELKENQKNKKDTKGKIVLSTMHASKGLEFEVVWIISAVEGVIPHNRSMTPNEIEEERRLFYVGLTRAKDRLYISTIDSRYEEEVAASRFLDEMEDLPCIEDFVVGSAVSHNHYGEGIIKELKESVATIKFKKQMLTKKIDIATCLKGKMITLSEGGN